jgi:hypothetical protein
MKDKTPLSIVTRGANLLNPSDVEALMHELKEIAKEAGMPIGLVIFDTYSRSTPGGKEDAEDTSAAIGVSDRLRDELGAATGFVHHSGKDTGKGARGHSSLEAAADTVIYVEGTVGGIVSGCVAEVEKVRDGTIGEQFPFRLDVVELGKDDDGDPVTTCVVVPTDAGVTKPKSPPLSGVARVALQALEEVLADRGSTMPETSTIPRGVKAARIEDWRARFVLRYGSDGERDGATVRQAFRRAKDSLLKVLAVGISDPYCWVNP